MKTTIHDMEITIKIGGNATAIAKALTTGFPKPALRAIVAGMTKELEERRRRPTRRKRPITVRGRAGK